MSETGVLLLGFGGPSCLEAVGPFMCRLMGREPSPELLQRVKTRYLAIGGVSPLLEIAASIAKTLAEKLEMLGKPMPVQVGMCYSDPFISDALERLADAGCSRVITLSLSPFESKVAQQSYRDAVSEAAGPLGIEIVEAPLVSTFPEFVDFLSGSVATAITDLEPNEGAVLAFTAHSLPAGELTEDDPYVAGLKSIANQVAGRLGLDPGVEGTGAPLFESFSAFGSLGPPRPWFLVYQSKGNQPGEWLGPDLDELIEACAEKSLPAIIVLPIGFMTDHMETMYDLDIVAADKALSLGLEFMRAWVPNDDDGLLEALARALVAI